jgi:hypothetical protein
MSGSLKWTYYQSDDNENWALFRDESNLEGIALADTDVDISSGSTIKYSLPRNVEPRFAIYKSTTTVKTRKITIPTRAMYDDLAVGGNLIGSRSFPEDGETFVIQSLSPERIRPIIISNDTQLNDGDAT